MTTEGGEQPGTARPDAATVRKWRDLLAGEREAAALYDSLADGAAGERAEILR